MRRALALFALLGWCLGATPGAAQQETPEDWPAGPGRDETFYLCTACHGGALVTQQGMSRDMWSATLDFMVERHGMPVPERAERDLILDYLAQSFAPRQRGPAPYSPFLQR